MIRSNLVIDCRESVSCAAHLTWEEHLNVHVLRCQENWKAAPRELSSFHTVEGALVESLG